MGLCTSKQFTSESNRTIRSYPQLTKSDVNGNPLPQVVNTVEDECPVSPPGKCSDSVNGSSSLVFNAKPKLFSSTSADPDSVQLVSIDLCF